MSIQVPRDSAREINDPGWSGAPAASQSTVKQAKRVGKNALALTISLVVLGVAQFAVLGLISRFGGAAEVGTWAYVTAFRDPFAVLMDFGITRLLIAEIARRRDETDMLMGNGLTIGMMIGIPVLIIMMVIANLPLFEHSPLVTRGIYLMGFGALFYTTYATFRSAFRAHNRFEYEAIISVITAILIIGGAFVALYFDFSFLWVFAAFTFAQFVAMVWAWATYNLRIGHFRFSFQRNTFWQLLSKTWAFTLVGLLTRAFTRVDVLILAILRGAAAAGFYALATTIFYQLNTIAQLANTALLPTMARTYVKTPNKVGQQLDAAVRVQVLVGLPCTAIGLILAPQIINFLFGDGYDASVVVLQLLILVVLLRFLNQTFGITLTAMDRQRRRAAALGVVVAFNIVLNVLLISRFGVLGATVTAVLSEILLFGLTYFMVVPDVRKGIQWRSLFRPLLSTVVLCPLIFLIQDWQLIISLSFSVIAYTLLIFLFRTFSYEEASTISAGISSIKRIPTPVRWRLSYFVIKFSRPSDQVPTLDEGRPDA